LSYKLYYLVLFILCLVLILPVIGIISKIDFEINYLINFFQEKYNIKIIFTSFIQALLSSIFSCLFAIPFALSLYRHKNSKLIKFIVSLCGYSFVIPSVLIIHSVVGIYGINGILNNVFNFYNAFNIESLFGLEGILIAHILLNAPFATRLFFQNLNTIPKNYIEVSNSLNLDFWCNLKKIEWPILKQNFVSVFSIIFVLCFLSFAIVMALGGGPSTSTMEVAIYQSALFELNFNKAIILSIIQIVICITFLLLGFFKMKGSNFFEIQINNFNHPFGNIIKIKLFDYLIIILFSIILFSPIIYILIKFISVVYFENYFFKKYFLEAFKNSFILSITTGILVTFMGFLISFLLVNFRKNFLLQQLLFIMSSMILIISPIIISLGYFIILGELRYFHIITYVVIITINCVFLIPFSILILFIKLKNIYLNYDEIKKSFNIGEINFIKIIYPLIKKNLIYIFSFSAVISFGDFTIISFFKTESFQTLPTLLYMLLTSYKFDEASFIAGFMLLFSILIYLFFDNLFHKDNPDINK